MWRLVLEYRDEFQHAIIILLFLAALRWGAGPERAIASALLYLVASLFLYHLAFGPGLQLGHMDLVLLANDLVAGCVMIGTALYANRIYTLWIGALQIIAILSHLARDLSEAISPLAYAIMFIAPSYLQIALLTGGLIAHRRRLKRYGTYRSWQTSSSHSPASARRSSPQD